MTLHSPNGCAALCRTVRTVRDAGTLVGELFRPALPPGAHLGRLAELGCGPYTYSYSFLRARHDLDASVITLLDPGIPTYLANGFATFANGTLRAGRGPIEVELLPMGAEELPSSCSGAYDTLIFINVLEHTFNAFATLYQAFRLLRPGGLLLLKERIVSPQAFHQVYHPVRLHTAFYERFFAEHFDAIVRNDTCLRGVCKMFVEREIAFAGRKKKHHAWAA